MRSGLNVGKTKMTCGYLPMAAPRVGHKFSIPAKRRLGVGPPDASHGTISVEKMGEKESGPSAE